MINEKQKETLVYDLIKQKAEVELAITEYVQECMNRFEEKTGFSIKSIDIGIIELNSIEERKFLLAGATVDIYL